MPPNIIAIPTTGLDVMPRIACLAFNEQMRWEALVNQDYADGSSDRAPLTTVQRSFFRMTGQVAGSQWLALRNFYLTHIGAPFFFYFLPQCVPPYSYDSTGAATDGRYTVVFDGGYSETSRPGAAQTVTTSDPSGHLATSALGIAQAQLQLREVE